MRHLPTTVPAFVTAAATGHRLVIAAAGDQLPVDVDARTIGPVLVAPFGKAGDTSGGRLSFSAGSLIWSSPRAVKMLREHDQGDSVGYATELAEQDAGPQGPGLYGTFHVPEGANGDRALAEAANGIRDGFSVGVQLDDATMLNLRRAKPGTTTPARGQLREVSLVSVPAFDDARVPAAAHADLVVSSWTTATTNPSAAGAGATTPEGSPMFTETQRRRLAQLLAQQTLTADETAERDQLQQAAAAAGVTVTAEDAQQQPAAPQAGQQQPAGQQPAGQQPAGQQPAGGATAGAQLTTAGLTQPGVVPAAAGGALVTGEPSPYTFSGSGPSLVRDMWDSSMRNDSAAAERVERFNRQLVDGNAPTIAALTTAAATRDDVDGAGTDLPQSWGAGPNARPELLRERVNQRRPFLSKLDTMPISDPRPFSIPKVGEFNGVDKHVEGTPHRPAGTFSLSGDVVQPYAVSGAWECSRELIDSGNPLLDRVAVRAMLRDYARKSEGAFIALLSGYAASAGADIAYGVDGIMALRGALEDFVNDDEEAADIAALSKGLMRQLLTEVDGMQRPQIPAVGPMNAVATTTGSTGTRGLQVDDTAVFRAARLDSAAGFGAASGIAARSEGLLWCESPVQQFRFDEVLGPGVIKLALWAYNGGAILDTEDVVILQAGADPTP